MYKLKIVANLLKQQRLKWGKEGYLCYINIIVLVATKLWHQQINRVHTVVHTISEVHMGYGYFVWWLVWQWLLYSKSSIFISRIIRIRLRSRLC